MLDIYASGITARPSPVYLWLHGGGYAGGDKMNVHPRLVARLALAGVSVVSANYRFSDDPELLAPLRDAVRALQFVRAHAAEYRLDPSRIALGGSSAGAASACWIALGPDRARPDSPDPVERQSTRVTCVAVAEAQTTLDPRAIRSLVPGPTWTLEALQKLLRLTPDQYDLPEHAKKLDAIECLAWVSRSSPPFFLRNATPDAPLTPELGIMAGIHHPVFGRALKAKLDPLGIECLLKRREDYPGLDDETLDGRLIDESVAFLVRHLGVV
ncbi:MAG: alpha/beta hydrolase [Verrucomicrobiae bacterium]|nr:alpha/beta hydrolase [Verrucomicrobiae bacterium]